ncbi:MAG: HEAT repeat domain-containing protein [Gammaproteobacteria bacterium]|nr:HEAT repeat domain-containing protein [Gammaproteobacteria bacterium]
MPHTIISKDQAQLNQFFVNGFVEIDLNLSSDTHSAIYDETDRLFQTLQIGSNPHNNIMPMVSGLHEVLDDVNLKNAISNLLGPNYLIHPHRHCHTNFPSDKNDSPSMLQPFHKDGHAHKPRPRHREPHWLILFYSPQETWLDRGPTAVLPGTHLLGQLSSSPPSRTPPVISQDGNQLFVDETFWARQVMPLTGGPKAVLCHFDLGHGAMRNITNLPRYVHKFVAMRTQEPVSHQNLPELSTDDPIQAHLWRWLGQKCTLMTSKDEQDFDTWQRNLHAPDPTISTRAIYLSAAVAAAHRDRVIEALIDAVRRDVVHYAKDEVLNIPDAVNGLVLIKATNALFTMLASAESALIATAAYGFGQLRHVEALPHLLKLLEHENPGVCRHAISAIGLINAAKDRADDASLDALQRTFTLAEDWDVRLFIIQAVIRLGFDMRLLPLLIKALSDEHPYVSHFAMEQLCRFDCDEARRAVIEPLRRNRWFPDPFFPI